MTSTHVSLHGRLAALHKQLAELHAEIAAVHAEIARPEVSTLDETVTAFPIQETELLMDDP